MQLRVVHNAWGKPITLTVELLPLVGAEHPAGWGSSGRSAARWRRQRAQAWAAPANAQACLAGLKRSTPAAGPMGAGDERMVQ